MRPSTLIAAWRRRAGEARAAADGRLDSAALDPALATIAYLNLPLLVMLLVAAVGFLLGAGLDPPTSGAGLGAGILAAFFVLRLDGRVKLRRNLLGAAAAAALYVAVAAATVWVRDTGWDSQAYHLPAILALAGGWNPVTEPGAAVPPWAVWYPKGAWVLSAQLYLLFGVIDLFRTAALVLAIQGGTLLYLALRATNAARAPLAAAIALLAAANPVVLAQALTGYVDGIVASLLLCLLAGAVLLSLRRSTALLAAMAAWLVLLVNLKFSGAVYGGLLLLGLWLYALAADRALRGPALALSAVFAVAVLVIGYAPYATNFAAHGTPFYPAAEAVVGAQRPANLAGASNLAKWFYSTFGVVDTRPGQDAVLKWPFEVSAVELRRMAAAEPRTGGFGALFGAEVALAAVLGLVAAGRRRLSSWLFALLGAAVFATVLAFPEPWWPRYVPQMWLVPLLLVAGLAGAWARPAERALAAGILVLAAFNAGVTGWQASAFRLSNDAWWDRQFGDRPIARVLVVSDPGWVDQKLFFELFRYRLDGDGIAAEIVPAEACAGRPVGTFAGTPVRFCLER